MVKFLQSNPVQIVLCVIVLLDAVIVIAQILLDLSSVKRTSFTPYAYLLIVCLRCLHSDVLHVKYYVVALAHSDILCVRPHKT